MSIRTIECKYCSSKVLYVPCANVVVFCPECKRVIFVECEYGYGPVTPCSILLGDETLGTVTENSEHEYILEIESEGKQVKLRERYLKALQEASKIFEERLSIAHKE